MITYLDRSWGGIPWPDITQPVKETHAIQMVKPIAMWVNWGWWSGPFAVYQVEWITAEWISCVVDAWLSLVYTIQMILPRFVSVERRCLWYMVYYEGRQQYIVVFVILERLGTCALAPIDYISECQNKLNRYLRDLSCFS